MSGPRVPDGSKIRREDVVSPKSLSLNAQWNDKDELSFVRGLGFHCNNRLPDLSASQHVEQLRGYLRSMEVRSNWGDMNPHKIKKHVNILIEGYEAVSQKKGSK